MTNKEQALLDKQDSYIARNVDHYSSSDETIGEDEASLADEIQIGDIGKIPNSLETKQNDLTKFDNG